MYPVVMVASILTVAAWEGGKRIWKEICVPRKRDSDNTETQSAREELIQGIREYDAEHSDTAVNICDNQEGGA